DRDHLGQHTVDRANDRDVGLDGFGDRGRIDVDVDDLGVRAELAGTVDHAVIETGTDGQDDVGVVHGQVRGIAAVHAEHADELAIRTRVATQPHQGVGDRQVEHARQLGELC